MTAEFKMCDFHSEQTPIMNFEYEDDFVRLTRFGILTLKPGFIFGASGPTFDRLPFGFFRKQMRTTRRGVAKHDAVYYMSDQGVFKGPKSKYIKALSDSMLKDDIILDGGWEIRAEAWEKAVEEFGNGAWESSD
jgi:hypothetical protein